MNGAQVRTLIKELPNYKQRRNSLKLGDRFCILGVGCDIYIKQRAKLCETRDIAQSFTEVWKTKNSIWGAKSQMPEMIRDYFGFTYAQMLELANRNDGAHCYPRHTFAELGKILEDWMEKQIADKLLLTKNISGSRT